MLKRLVCFMLSGIIAIFLISGCSITNDDAGTTLPTTEPTTATVPTTTAPPPTTLPPETTPPTEPPYHEDIMAVPMIRMMGMLYVLDKAEDSFTQQLPDNYVYLGFCYENNDSIPKRDTSSRYIPSYAELYASLEVPDYIYYDTGEGYQRLIRAALVENTVSKDDPDNTVPEAYIQAFFNTLLQVDAHNPYAQAAGQVFYQPEEVDLYMQFYNGFREWSHYEVPLTGEEETFLAANGWGEKKSMSNARRFPISAMDQQLQRFFGITFWESWGVGLDRMEHYREENQCYYHWRSDTRGSQATISSVEKENDTYRITYQLKDDYYGNTYRMTLIKTDGVLQIYSNVIIK